MTSRRPFPFPSLASVLPAAAAVAIIAFANPPALAQLRQDGATASFRRSLPPKSIAPLDPEQEQKIEQQLSAVQAEFEAIKAHPRAADAAIFLKAVRYALDFDEWYDKKSADGAKKALALLDEARARIASLKENKTPWLKGAGQKIVGYFSRIDGSAQPYGIEIPEGLDWGADKKPVPMWIWLHGRGDTSTDLHFIYGKLTAKKPGQFQPKGSIVIHPFGRYCNGWKSAGETDVFEARDDAKARFNVDANRIALAGFSMGGAGAWHIGAHFADQWACVHTGAGFVDVKRYQKLTPEKMPVWYEQTLWSVYDVPNYARNFHNVPLVMYSGENDGQRDSAEYMTEVLAKEGIKPPHLIGPGMGHKYHPEVIKDVEARIEAAVAKGRDPLPKKITLQTRCTRYGKMFWVEVTSLTNAWEDTRVEAEIDDANKKVVVKTQNVASLKVTPAEAIGSQAKAYKIEIDGQPQVGKGGGFSLNPDGRWRPAMAGSGRGVKGRGFDGIIDQAFHDRFIIVLPDAPCANPKVDEWVRAESSHFIQRWRSLMRGDPIVKKPTDLTPEERAGQAGFLCLWGDAQGNSLLAYYLAELPLKWNDQDLTMAGKTYPAATHVPVMAFQGVGDTGKPWRIVLNSGLTFREAHDRTNSLQNPKLPDWSILDITTPPSAEAAGKVVAADFFDRDWRVKQKN